MSLSRQNWKRRAFPNCRLLLAHLLCSQLLSSCTPGLLRLALGYMKKLRKRSHRSQKRKNAGATKKPQKPKSHRSPLKATEATKQKKKTQDLKKIYPPEHIELTTYNPLPTRLACMRCEIREMSACTSSKHWDSFSLRRRTSTTAGFSL